jgi:hypothetical protein
MNRKFASAIVIAAIAVVTVGGSRVGATTAVVNFESTPPISTGPSIYVAVPGPQTITTAPATFSGGVVLGFATFFPAISFATPPNVYGTANFGNGLPEQLSIAIDPTFATTEVSFALFNGETFNQTYTVNAFNGASLVASQTLTNIAPNFNSGYGLVDLLASGGITSVTVAPTGAPAAWDFLIDTVAFNQNITNVITTPLPPVFQPPVSPVIVPPQIPTVPLPHGHHHNGEGHEGELVQINFGDDINDIRGSLLVVPEPATYAMLLTGLGVLGGMGLRQKRQGT